MPNVDLFADHNNHGPHQGQQEKMDCVQGKNGGETIFTGWCLHPVFSPKTIMAPLNEESVQEVELTSEQKATQLNKLMSDGKRELKALNYEPASQKFGEAAEFAATHYGPLAVESFEPNFMYGRTLAELSGVENDLFQSALVNIKKKEGDEAEEKDAANESMDDEKREDVREMVAEALAETAEELEKKKGGSDEESKSEEVKEKESVDEAAAGDKMEEDEKAENEEIAADNDESEEAADGEKEEGADGDVDNAEKEDIEDGEEEVDTNQLAWKALEVASQIADKMITETGDKEWKHKRVDVFVQLAQCSCNDEKYETALEDLGRAHALMEEIATEKGDRLTAEIFFHEGRINRLRNEFGLAEVSFNKAGDVFQKILDALKTEAGDSPTEDQTMEIAEIEQIMKDFKERAEDSKESAVQKKKMDEEKEKEKAEVPSILTTSNANSDATANDITSLVRKKRAHDDSEVEGAPKKAKSEEVEEKGEENIAWTVRSLSFLSSSLSPIYRNHHLPYSSKIWHVMDTKMDEVPVFHSTRRGLAKLLMLSVTDVNDIGLMIKYVMEKELKKRDKPNERRLSNAVNVLWNLLKKKVSIVHILQTLMPLVFPLIDKSSTHWGVRMISILIENVPEFSSLSEWKKIAVSSLDAIERVNGRVPGQMLVTEEAVVAAMIIIYYCDEKMVGVGRINEILSRFLSWFPFTGESRECNTIYRFLLDVIESGHFSTSVEPNLNSPRLLFILTKAIHDEAVNDNEVKNKVIRMIRVMASSSDSFNQWIRLSGLNREEQVTLQAIITLPPTTE
ncbi:nasp-2 [Pristionchus pacificus]|uniref:Uncharacterized protein n=1 Tax=Pristionchus pacificus TaxID=54126 RepID=A0A2A6CZ93_PRIPA|nr:nasp-2 [Pristionchus pacificus]|eukprot:PDM83351.1 hypothetical protein PRIPAC_34983 [Pristionchus pacificus]